MDPVKSPCNSALAGWWDPSIDREWQRLFLRSIFFPGSRHTLLDKAREKISATYDLPCDRAPFCKLSGDLPSIRRQVEFFREATEAADQARVPHEFMPYIMFLDEYFAARTLGAAQENIRTLIDDMAHLYDLLPKGDIMKAALGADHTAHDAFSALAVYGTLDDVKMLLTRSRNPIQLTYPGHEPVGFHPKILVMFSLHPPDGLQTPGEIYSPEITLKAYSDFSRTAAWTLQMILARHITRKNGRVTKVSAELVAFARNDPELLAYLKGRMTKDASHWSESGNEFIIADDQTEWESFKKVSGIEIGD